MAAREGAEGSGGKMRAGTGTTISSWPGAFSFLPQQLAPSGRHSRLVWAPAEVRQDEEKREENMLGFFFLL